MGNLPIKNTVDLQSLELKIARSENLPVLPQIVSQVLKLADDPDASPRAMEQIIERDPAIAAKILKVASSSHYGNGQVAGIGRAISMLGMNSVRSLVVGVAYQQLMGNKSIASQFNKLEYWRHCLGVATTARIIAKLRMPMRSEELYVAGMMHDIGLLVMDRFHPLDLDQTLKAATQRRLKLHQVEKALYGFDHAEVGAMLAERWGMSNIVLDAVRYHHSPEAEHENRQYTAVIALADQLAHQSGLTNNVPGSDTGIDESLLEIVGLPSAQLEIIKTVVAQEIVRAEEAFSI